MVDRKFGGITPRPGDAVLRIARNLLIRIACMMPKDEGAR